MNRFLTAQRQSNLLIQRVQRHQMMSVLFRPVAASSHTPLYDAAGRQRLPASYVMAMRVPMAEREGIPIQEIDKPESAPLAPTESGEKIAVQAVERRFAGEQPNRATQSPVGSKSTMSRLAQSLLQRLGLGQPSSDQSIVTGAGQPVPNPGAVATSDSQPFVAPGAASAASGLKPADIPERTSGGEKKSAQHSDRSEPEGNVLQLEPSSLDKPVAVATGQAAVASLGAMTTHSPKDEGRSMAIVRPGAQVGNPTVVNSGPVTSTNATLSVSPDVAQEVGHDPDAPAMSSRSVAATSEEYAGEQLSTQRASELYRTQAKVAAAAPSVILPARRTDDPVMKSEAAAHRTAPFSTATTARVVASALPAAQSAPPPTPGKVAGESMEIGESTVAQRVVQATSGKIVSAQLLPGLMDAPASSSRSESGERVDENEARSVDNQPDWKRLMAIMHAHARQHESSAMQSDTVPTSEKGALVQSASLIQAADSPESQATVDKEAAEVASEEGGALRVEATSHLSPSTSRLSPASQDVADVLRQTPPARATDSAIHVIAPRGPRPLQRSPAPTRVADEQPASGHRPDAAGANAVEMVHTDIGDLPTDLWALIGEAPPALPQVNPLQPNREAGQFSTNLRVAVDNEPTIGALAQKSQQSQTSDAAVQWNFAPYFASASPSANATSEQRMRTETSMIASGDGATAAPIVQRQPVNVADAVFGVATATGASAAESVDLADSPVDQTPSRGISAVEPDVQELARQVYAQLRRRLVIERERLG